jgi:hypothetical protein
MLHTLSYFKVGHELRHYEDVFDIRELVGQGANGCVYRVDTQSGDQVAIKIQARAWLFAQPANIAAAVEERKVLRIMTERRVAFMTSLLSSWSDDDNVYFVMVSMLV